MAANTIVRATFTVARRPDGWTVEHDGEDHGAFKTREEAMASATRHANASQNAGAPAQIQFADEPSFSRG